MRKKEIIFGVFVMAAIGVILLPLFLSNEKKPTMSFAALPPVPSHALGQQMLEEDKS